MQELPKISVVTPSYQQGDTLEGTIKSVIEQGYPRLEYIVCDGGSTDGSKEILERYTSAIDWWVSEPDGGQTAAIRKGFERATGDILCWLNSDDEFTDGTLLEVGEMFARQPDISFVYGDVEFTDRGGKHLEYRREIDFSWFVWLWWYNYLPQPSVFWRSTLYREAGGLDPSFSLAMDADLWERMASIERPVHFSRVWSRMRVYPEQRNQAFRAQSDEEDLMIRCRHQGRKVGRIELSLRHVLAGAGRLGMRALALGRRGRVGLG